MKHRSYILALVTLVLTAGLLASRRESIRKAPVLRAGGPRATVAESYAKLPLRFEENVGQIDPDVKFFSRGPGYALFLTATEAVIRLQDQRPPQGAPSAAGAPDCAKPCSPSQGEARPAGDGLSLSHPQELPRTPGTPAAQGRAIRANRQAQASPESSSAVIRMQLVGASRSTQLEGVDPLPGRSNYFLGNNPALWRKDVPNYGKVLYRQVYPGIDLVYYGNPQQLEYDFVISPGADASAIRLRVQGSDQVTLDDKGNLILSAANRNIRLQEPAVYQEANGKRQQISTHYVLLADNEIGFALGAYDHSRKVTIDPVLLYSTYYGGSVDEDLPISGYNSGGAIAVDSAGNNYITGYTDSPDFPLLNCARCGQTGAGTADAFIVKIDPTGSKVLYSTFLGGEGNDFASGIAVDSSGNAYVTGNTSSEQFPAQPANAFRLTPCGNAATDAFLTKISSSGSSLVYSTYLCGNSPGPGGTSYLFTAGSAVAVDSSGSAYVAGYTGAADFPHNGGFQQSIHGLYTAFVTKFNAAGSGLAYSTYLGGSYEDNANGISVDGAGNAYVTGATASSDFPTTSGAFDRSCGTDGKCNLVTNVAIFTDVFVSKLNSAGSGLLYSTFVGGSSTDVGTSIAIDSAGDAFVTGYTISTDFPVGSTVVQPGFGGAGNTEAFVIKVNPGGSNLTYSTYLGGSGGDTGSGIAVDSSGNAYVAGQTFSVNFPLAGNPVSTSLGGTEDAFVSKIDPTGTVLVYSTYVGGSLADGALGIAVDAAGVAHVTGFTQSTNFPTSTPVQASLDGGSDAFLFALRDSAAGGPNLPPNSAVNGFSFVPQQGLAPGSFASVFGSDLSDGNPADTTLTLNGVSAAIYNLNSGQINFQVPWEAASAGATTTLIVRVAGIPSNPLTVSLAQFGPGIYFFARTDGVTNQGAILIAGTNAVAAPTGTVALGPAYTSRPAVRGTDYLSIYCTGLGPVVNQPADGVVADPTGQTVSLVITPPTVTFIGVANGVFTQLTVPAAGAALAPGTFGEYQVNVQVPATVPSGPLQMYLSSGSVNSNTVQLAVQ